MKTEKGFATIFSLCLILVIALIVKGIQEAETNHAYETANFQAEMELQNAADSALIEIADKILSGEETLPTNEPYMRRRNFQREFTVNKTSKRLGKITIIVCAEKVNVQAYNVNYAVRPKPKAIRVTGDDVKGYVLFSMAQVTSDHGGEIYRRSFAYVKPDDEAIHFMELPSSDYNF